MGVKIGGNNIKYCSLSRVVRIWEVAPEKKLYMFKDWVANSIYQYFQSSAVQSHNKIIFLLSSEVIHGHTDILLWPKKRKKEKKKNRSDVSLFQVEVLGATVQIIMCPSYFSGIVKANTAVLYDNDELRPQLTYNRQYCKSGITVITEFLVSVA